MIVNEEQAKIKALQLLGNPSYFRVVFTKLQPAIDDGEYHLCPQWLVTADIGKRIKAATVCIMFPNDMEINES